jgi:hypothetical protein
MGIPRRRQVLIFRPLPNHIRQRGHLVAATDAISQVVKEGPIALRPMVRVTLRSPTGEEQFGVIVERTVFYSL